MRFEALTEFYDLLELLCLSARGGEFLCFPIIRVLVGQKVNRQDKVRLWP